jgi:hypothetical protein
MYIEKSKLLAMTDNQMRQMVLLDYFQHRANSDNPINVDFAILNSGLVNNFPGNRDQRERAVRYLIAYGYFNSYLHDDNWYVSATKLGAQAANGEFFIHEHNKERREKMKHRYTILFGAIAAAGVIFAIIKDSVMKSQSSKLEIVVSTQPQSKIEDSVLAPLKTISVSVKSDSLNK